MVYELTWFKKGGVKGTQHRIATSDGVVVETTMENNIFVGRDFEDLKVWLEGKRVDIKRISQKTTLSEKSLVVE